MGLMGFTETPHSSNPPCSNHRSLLSKSAGNGVWTLRISSVHPFDLFLICINGNSVCFNLCDGIGCRAEEVPFLYPTNHRGGQQPFLVSLWYLLQGMSPFHKRSSFVRTHQSACCLHQIQDRALNLFSPGHTSLYFSVQKSYKMNTGWKCLEGGACTPWPPGCYGWQAPFCHAGS